MNKPLLILLVNSVQTCMQNSNAVYKHKDQNIHGVWDLGSVVNVG